MNKQDIDFLKMMIPHHLDAVRMAKAQLREGENKELKALAEQIISAQENEISFMRQALAKSGSKENSATGSHRTRGMVM